MKRSPKIIIALLLFHAVMFYGYYRYVRSIDIGEKVVTIIIKPGDTLGSIARKLVAEGVVDSRSLLVYPARLMSIDKKLGGNGILPQDIGFSFTKPDEETLTKTIDRPEEKSISLNERKRGFAEVVLGLDRSVALAEAGRCLRCDLEK